MKKQYRLIYILIHFSGDSIYIVLIKKKCSFYRYKYVQKLFVSKSTYPPSQYLQNSVSKGSSECDLCVLAPPSKIGKFGDPSGSKAYRQIEALPSGHETSFRFNRHASDLCELSVGGSDISLRLHVHARQ